MLYRAAGGPRVSKESRDRAQLYAREKAKEGRDRARRSGPQKRVNRRTCRREVVELSALKRF